MGTRGGAQVTLRVCGIGTGAGHCWNVWSLVKSVQLGRWVAMFMAPKVWWQRLL